MRPAAVPPLEDAPFPAFFTLSSMAVVSFTMVLGPRELEAEEREEEESGGREEKRGSGIYPSPRRLYTVGKNSLGESRP